MPWLDEVMFSSVAHSLRTTGHFVCEVLPNRLHGQEVLFYGPNFFFLASLFERFFGFGIVQYRLVSLLSGFVMIFVALRFFKAFSRGGDFAVLLCLLMLLFEPGVFSSMHGGRMDLMATCWMLGASYFFLRSENKQQPLSRMFDLGLTAIFGAMGVLTTPRSGFLLLSIAILMVLRLVKRRDLQTVREVLISTLIFSVPFLIWFLYAFGSLAKLTAVLGAAHSSDRFIGGNFLLGYRVSNYLPAQLALMAAFLLCLCLTLFGEPRKILTKPVLLAILNVFAFYILVFEVGVYYIYIIPFCLFFIVEVSVYYKARFSSLWSYLVPGFLLLIGIGFFLVKMDKLIAEWDQRSPNKINAFVSSKVPASSVVIGDARYYYAVKLGASDFRLTEGPSGLVLQCDQLGETKKTIYVLVPAKQIFQSASIYNSLVANGYLEEKGRLSSDKKQSLISLKGAERVTDSYDCILYLYHSQKNKTE